MNIWNGVKDVIYHVIGIEEITFDQVLKEDIGLDSLSLVSVIVELEEKFSIEFKDKDLDPSKVIKVGDLVELVEKYV